MHAKTIRGCHWLTLESVASRFTMQLFEYDNTACVCVCVVAGKSNFAVVYKSMPSLLIYQRKTKCRMHHQTNWWCPFECQPGLPHNRINAWIWSERTNTRWTLIKNPSGKDFNEILRKVNKLRCQAEHENGLYGLFTVVMNKITSQHGEDSGRN